MGKIKMSDRSEEILKKGLESIPKEEQEEAQRKILFGLLIKISLEGKEVDIEKQKLLFICAGIIDPSNDDLIKILRSTTKD